MKEKATWHSIKSKILKILLIMMKHSIEILRAWASISFQKILSLLMQFLFTQFQFSCLITPPLVWQKTKNLKESIFSTDIYLGDFLFNQQDAKLFVCVADKNPPALFTVHLLIVNKGKSFNESYLTWDNFRKISSLISLWELFRDLKLPKQPLREKLKVSAYSGYVWQTVQETLLDMP